MKSTIKRRQSTRRCVGGINIRRDIREMEGNVQMYRREKQSFNCVIQRWTSASLIMPSVHNRLIINFRIYPRISKSVRERKQHLVDGYRFLCGNIIALFLFRPIIGSWQIGTWQQHTTPPGSWCVSGNGELKMLLVAPREWVVPCFQK